MKRRLIRYAILFFGGIGGSMMLQKWMDMIRQQAAQAAQAEAARERQRFLQRLDHELKNPLTAMQIALANLDEINDAETRRQIRDGMQGQIGRISHLISSLRKLAMLETGPLERMPIDVVGLLEEITLITQDAIGADARRIVFEGHARPLPLVEGDRDLIQLAVYNLLDNAAKFTRFGDTITVRARAENGYVVIEVEDTGRGILPEDLPHVWEDLYRGRDVHGIPGSGVGLAMVRGIMEKHGGEARISSRPDQGTIVTVSLPVENDHVRQ